MPLLCKKKLAVLLFADDTNLKAIVLQIDDFGFGKCS